MSNRRIAVFDIGKTNAKLVVRDMAAGADVFLRTRPNQPLQSGPYPHFDVDGLFDFGLTALAEAGPIDAISITTHGASGVLLAGDELALPVLDYEHPGIDATTEAYDRVRPDFAEILSPRLPGGLNVGAQLFWQQATFPAEFARATDFLTYPQYWAWRLTGVKATETTSLGCHTDLWNPAAADFSSLVDRMGWRHLMAPRRSAFDCLGPIRPEIAARTGLAPTTPVYCGIHDSNASLLPHLVGRPAPFTVLSTGTWIIIFAVGGSLDRLDGARDGLANVDAFGRAVPSARLMGGREFEILTEGVIQRPLQSDVDAVLDGNIMVLPTFAPGTGPYPGSAGTWTVDPRTLSPAMRTAAASLYLALATSTALKIAGSAGPLIVEGPLMRNDLFLDALGFLEGRPVETSSDSTGTAAGAALLALDKRETKAPVPERASSYLLSKLQSYRSLWHSLADSRNK